MTIIIAAICAWNEEQFIKQCIESIIAKIKDISIIEILDGAWVPYSTGYPLSTDNTNDIILDLQEKYKHLCKIVFRKPAMVFESESQKRNRQLQIIENEYFRADHIILVIDADETIQSATGQQSFDLVHYMYERPDIACLKAYAHGSKISGWTPRIFRGGKQIHYHTNRTMEVHGKNCLLQIPYDINAQKDWRIRNGSFEIMDLFLVNQYNKRDLERRTEKLESRKYESDLPTAKCDYK